MGAGESVGAGTLPRYGGGAVGRRSAGLILAVEPSKSAWTESARTESAIFWDLADSESPRAVVGYRVDGLGRERAASGHHSFQPRQVVRDDRKRTAGHDGWAGADRADGVARSHVALHASRGDSSTLLRSVHQYSLLTGCCNTLPRWNCRNILRLTPTVLLTHVLYRGMNRLPNRCPVVRVWFKSCASIGMVRCGCSRWA